MNRQATSVPVESTQVGDLIALTWKDDDVTRTAFGRVADIRYAGKTRIFMSEHDHEIGRYDVQRPRKVQCVVYERYEPMPPALFELEEV